MRRGCDGGWNSPIMWQRGCTDGGAPLCLTVIKRAWYGSWYCCSSTNLDFDSYTLDREEEIHRSCHAELILPIAKLITQTLLTWESIRFIANILNLPFFPENNSDILRSNGFKLLANVCICQTLIRSTIRMDSNKWSGVQ